jgi:4-hydroxybenzoate polyprenyltransferase
MQNLIKASLTSSWSVALRLGRVSNLPTVWSNVLAGVTLAGGTPSDPRLPLLLVALSLSYVGGMYLNDWFDRDIDSKQRPERPIPASQVSANTVFTAGMAMLAVSVAVLVWVGYGFPAGTGWRAPAAGVALAAAIVFYDWRHKGNPLSPVVMGLCRLLVYVVAGYAVVDSPPAQLWWGAVLLLCYLIGLTYVAKQETLDVVRNLWPLGFLALPLVYAALMAGNGAVSALLFVALAAWVTFALHFLWRRRPGDVPRAVVSLIAGISLLDAVFIAAFGSALLAAFAVAAFVITLALQRVVAGT